MKGCYPAGERSTRRRVPAGPPRSFVRKMLHHIVMRCQWRAQPEHRHDIADTRSIPAPGQAVPAPVRIPDFSAWTQRSRKVAPCEFLCAAGQTLPGALRLDGRLGANFFSGALLPLQVVTRRSQGVPVPRPPAEFVAFRYTGRWHCRPAAVKKAGAGNAERALADPCPQREHWTATVVMSGWYRRSVLVSRSTASTGSLGGNRLPRMASSPRRVSSQPRSVLAFHSKHAFAPRK